MKLNKLFMFAVLVSLFFTLVSCTNDEKKPTNDVTNDETSEVVNPETSENPSLEPTKEPTKEPSKEPTKEETLEPTKEETKEPTVDPTIEPTPDPTPEPTPNPDKPVEPGKNGQLEPVDNTQYYFGMYQGVALKQVFITGNMKGFYFETTTEPEAAVKVTAHEVLDGWTLSFKDVDGKTQYLDITKSDDGKHTNAVFTTQEAVLTWNKETFRFEKTLDKVYAFGTRGDKEYLTIGATFTDKPSFYAGLYDLNNPFPEQPEPNPDPNPDLPLPQPGGDIIPENEPASVTEYYKNVDNSLRGDALIDSITPVINKGFVHHAYGSSLDSILLKSDADPKHPGNIICFYTGQSLPRSQWNREHVWAKSHGFDSKGYNAYSDAHHLRPTLNQINSDRGNKDFDEVSGGSSDGFGNHWNSQAFEPRDEVKGDVARIMFYMVAKYNKVEGLDLELVDRYTSTGVQKFGKLSTLLKWHYEDPVSEFEMHRNNVIYSMQKNRNPFIDRPEYVGLCFQSNMSVDQAKVDNVKTKITALPKLEEITLDSESVITEVNKLYLALNAKERSLVTNYETLRLAVNKLNELKGEKPNPNPNPEPTPDPNPNPNPVLPEGDKLFHTDFGSGIPKTDSYQHDLTLMVGGKEFYASTGFSNGSSLRLGFNAKKAKTLDPKYGLGEVNGAVLEAKFDVENINGLTLEVANVYGGTNSYAILFQETGSSTYEKIVEGTFDGQSALTLSASLETPRSGHFVVAILGDAARIDLGSYDILTPKALSFYTNYDLTENKKYLF